MENSHFFLFLSEIKLKINKDGPVTPTHPMGCQSYNWSVVIHPITHTRDKETGFYTSSCGEISSDTN
jgi:hypothetical protein